MKTNAENPNICAPVGDELTRSAQELRRAFEHHLRCTLAKDRYTATIRDRYYAFALAVRDRVIERWIPTQQRHHDQKVKRAYYLSLEFLIGQSLEHNVMNLRLEAACREVALELGLNWNDLLDQEIDAGLGNGGL